MSLWVEERGVQGLDSREPGARQSTVSLRWPRASCLWRLVALGRAGRISLLDEALGARPAAGRNVGRRGVPARAKGVAANQTAGLGLSRPQVHASSPTRLTASAPSLRPHTTQPLPFTPPPWDMAACRAATVTCAPGHSSLPPTCSLSEATDYAWTLLRPGTLPLARAGLHVCSTARGPGAFPLNSPCGTPPQPRPAPDQPAEPCRLSRTHSGLLGREVSSCYTDTNLPAL